MNLSKKVRYLVLLPIIAFMAVAIALCACIGIKGADGTTSGNDHYAFAAGEHVHDEVTFDTGLSSGDLLSNISEGNYYLTENITWSEDSITIDGKVNICLNGFTLNFASEWNSIYVNAGATLGIYGCNGGELTNSDMVNKRLIYVYDGGSVNLFGGTVSTTRARTVELQDGGSFTMTGGSLINNYSAEEISNEQQVSVYANSSSCAIKITGGNVTGKIYAQSAIDLDGYVGSPIPLFNNSISGENYVLVNNATSGTVIELLYSSYLPDYVKADKTIVTVGAYVVEVSLVNAKRKDIEGNGELYQKLKLGEFITPIILETEGEFNDYATGLDSSYFNYWVNGNGTATIESNGTEITNQGYSFSITVEASAPHIDGGLTFVGVDNSNSFGDGGNYFLTSSVIWNIPNTFGGYGVVQDLSICLNGYSLTLQGDFPNLRIMHGKTLRIFDCNSSGAGGGSVIFRRNYLPDNSYDPAYIYYPAIMVDGGTLEIYGGKFSSEFDNEPIGGIQLGMQWVSEENYLYGNVKIYGGDFTSFANPNTGRCIESFCTDNIISIHGGVFGPSGTISTLSAIDADGYDGDVLPVYYDGISEGVTVLKNSTVDKLNLLNDGYFAKQSGADVIAVLPKTVTVTLEHATVTNGALLTQTVGGSIAEIVIKAEDGYRLPATLEIGYGLTYKLASDGLSATISGEPTADTAFTVTCEVADSRTPVDIPSAGSKDYTGETLISDLVDTELYTVTTNAGGIVAGEYEVKLTLKDNISYRWATGDADDAVRTIKFVINKATNEWTIALDMAGWTYGATASDPTATAKFGEVVFTYATSEDGAYGSEKPATAGTYYVKATVTGTDNYTGLTATKSFVIDTVKVTKPAADETVFTYDGTEKTYTVADNAAYTISGNKQTNADTYTVTVALNDKVNYEWADGTTDNVTFTFIINKATVEVPSAGSKEYTGETLVSDLVANSLYTVTTNNGGTEAGDYSVVLALVDSGNYKWATGGDNPERTVKFTITKATNEWKNALAMNGWTYGATASDPTATAKFGTAVYTYATSEDGAYGSEKPATAGTYYVKATVTGTDNYAGLTATKSFVIDTVKVDKPEADETVFTYDGTEKTYTVATDAAYTVSGNTRTLAGRQTVTVTLNDKVNYAWVDGTNTDVTFTFIINKAQIAKPVADETVFTYDGTEKTYTVATDAAYTVSGNTRTLAGRQTVTVTLNDKVNYAWVDGTNTDVTFTFIINKAQIAKPVADETVFTYNKAEQTYAVAENPAYSVDGNTQTNAGTYIVTVTLNDKLNYVWADGTTENVTFDFVINKAVYDMSNVTFADKSVKADGNAQSIVIGGNLPDGVTVRYEGNGKTEAGVYTVVAIFTGDADNYEAIADKTATLTVLSAGISESVPGNETDKPDAIIESEEGLNPNFELVVEEITTKESVNKVIKKNEVIEKAYEVTLKSDGVVVQPDGTLTVKLLLPETLKGKNFRILSSENGENLQETEYAIEGDYVVFTTDRIAEFSFVTEKDSASLLWLIILLSILLVLELLLAAYKLNKDGKEKKESKSCYAIAPFMLAAAFPPAQVTAVIVLAILDVICGAYDVYLFLRRKREPKIKTAGASEANAYNDVLAASKYDEDFDTMFQPAVEMNADLKVAIGMAKASSHKLDMSKKKIADHLKGKFGNTVEVNNHPNYTRTNLPLSDNHYTLRGVQSNGRIGRVCFVYVYELEGGKMFLLIKTNAEHAEEIKKKHPQVMRSRFPKNGEWYSVIVDESFRNDKEIYEIVDKAKDICERQ